MGVFFSWYWYNYWWHNLIGHHAFPTKKLVTTLLVNWSFDILLPSSCTLKSINYLHCYSLCGSLHYSCDAVIWSIDIITYCKSRTWSIVNHRIQIQKLTPWSVEKPTEGFVFKGLYKFITIYKIPFFLYLHLILIL